MSPPTMAPGPQCPVHCLPYPAGALQIRRPLACPVLPAADLPAAFVSHACHCLGSFSHPLSELFSLLPIRLPYPLSLEVAKVDSLFSYLSSKLSTPVLSLCSFSNPTPLLSKKPPLPSHHCVHPGFPKPHVCALHSFCELAYLCT